MKLFHECHCSICNPIKVCFHEGEASTIKHLLDKNENVYNRLTDQQIRLQCAPIHDFPTVWVWLLIGTTSSLLVYGLILWTG